MRSFTVAVAALAAIAAPILSASAGQGSHHLGDRGLLAAPLRSRHGARSTSKAGSSLTSPSKRSSTLKKRKTCKPKGSSSGGSSTSSSSNPSSTGGSSSGGSTSGGTTADAGVDWDVNAEFLKTNNIMIGFLPDDGSGGGSVDSLADINKLLPAKSAWYGRYAQVTNGKTFDGSQLYSVLDDVKASGSILAASVMPYGTWYGLTESDNRNAVAIAKVCNDIYKNHGVEVWLRFAHEMNWYQTDGTYSGGVSDFQTGWKVLSAAIEEYAPETKLWWSPNVGSDADYEKYWPTSGRVDVVGFDWYPNEASTSFVDRAKPFHDKYATDGRIMCQGETGLHYTGSYEERMQWVKSLSSAETQAALPQYVGWMWFNYDKFENGRQVDFKIIKPKESASSGINSMAISFFKSG